MHHWCVFRLLLSSGQPFFISLVTSTQHILKISPVIQKLTRQIFHPKLWPWTQLLPKESNGSMRWLIRRTNRCALKCQTGVHDDGNSRTPQDGAVIGVTSPSVSPQLSEVLLGALNQNLVQFTLRPGVQVTVYAAHLSAGKQTQGVCSQPHRRAFVR